MKAPMLALLLALAPAAPARTQLTAVQGSPSIVVSPPAAPVRRAPVSYTFEDAGVVVTGWSAWPDMLYQGFQPITFEAVNSSGEERKVDFELHRGWGEDRWVVRESVTVAPRGRERIELFVPVARLYDSDYMAHVVCSGEKTYLQGLGASQQANHLAWPVIYAHASARAPEPGAIEGWAAALGAHPPEGLPGPPTPQNRHLHTLGHVSSVPATSSTAHGWTIEITPVVFDELATRFEPYTSLKAVLLDAQSGLPRPEAVEAMLRWARLGGCLVFQGPDADALARSVPAAGAWMEERFLVSSSGRDRVYACGQGTLVVAAQNDLHDLRTVDQRADFTSTLQLLGQAMARAFSFAGAPQSSIEFDKLPGLSGLDLPYRALTVLLVLFAIVIGPLNLMVVKRLNRPALLLVTVPVIALVFSVGLFVYGALAQGLGTRVRSRSLTWLDQRAHVASTLELRSTFAGMPAGDGWVPGPGGACIPMPEAPKQLTLGQLELDFREGLVFGGDQLPVRREARNAFLVDRAARARLEVTRDGERVVVENGLGAAIEQLVLRDENGGWHALDGVLAQGARATLAPLARADEAVDRTTALLGDTAGLASTTVLAPASYAARLAAGAFVDPCGIEYQEEESTHVVLGILDAQLGGNR